VGTRLRGKGFQVLGSTTQSNKFVELERLGINPFLIDLSDETKTIIGDFFDTDVLLISIPPKLRSIGAGNYVDQMKRAREMVLKQQVRHVIFISSTAVYPDLNREVFEADADPKSPLVEAENIFLEEKTLATTILRFGGLVGPARHPGKFLAGKKDVNGATNPVNIIHQEDCVNIIETIIHQNAWNKTFNASADLHPSKKEFYTQASKLLQLDPPQFSNDIAPYKIVNSDQLKQKLSFVFQYPDPLAMLA
jgi:nucleoside-diphosphate-sugar epimerase